MKASADARANGIKRDRAIRPYLSQGVPVNLARFAYSKGLLHVASNEVFAGYTLHVHTGEDDIDETRPLYFRAASGGFGAVIKNLATRYGTDRPPTSVGQT